MVDIVPPKVMGVLNITPDSFSDGGFYFSLESALDRAATLIDQGADILDIGGESTRPGAKPVSLEEELCRVIPTIEAVCSRFDIEISIDTSKPAVMQAAVEAGATIVNDVYGLRTEGALEVVSEMTCPVCLMHMQGKPETMQDSPNYENLFDEIHHFFSERIAVCEAAGINRERLILDPGIGFGKTHPQNLQLVANIDRLAVFGLPILVGVSRKSMIGNILGQPAEQRMIGSVAAAILAAWQGASILRVHDVKETVEALAVCNALKMERV